MIELRWVLKKGDAGNWPVRILQYRQMETVDNGVRMSAWRDVPTETEDQAMAREE